MGIIGKSFALLLILVFITSLIILPHATLRATSPRTIIVPNDYSTIQEAIDNANAGDTVFVKNGIYNEPVFIGKPLLLIGEDPKNTIIVGSGTGTVVQISSSNVEIDNFTIKNAGTSQWFGQGFPDSCISVEESTNVTIRNNIVTNATVGIWSYASPNMDSVQNVVSNTTTMGIVAYTCTNNTIRDSVFQECGIVGVHLDGNSANCEVLNNTITDCGEGIEIEKSAQNTIEENKLLNNNASVILSSCGKSNVLTKNVMNGFESNLVVWGTTEEAYIQTIDTSNLMDGKKVYYIVDSIGATFDGSGQTDLGYFAIVNCTKMTIENVDLPNNKDGLLIAWSTNCSLLNATLSGNLDTLIQTGLIFFKSEGNTVQDCTIENNSMGIGFYQSNGNTFSHNSFIDNAKQVVSNFSSPFTSPSGVISVNKWDNGEEGNYWSNYQTKYPDAKEIGNSGVGNTQYVIDSSNIDRYPLIHQVYITAPTPSPTPYSALGALISPLTITIIVTVAVLVAVIVSLLLYRRHREVSILSK